ncbi:unnamed protein product [Cyclocybe aegerita]|uniref:Multidrug resistance-associated ABC transporter n=1 Tax=Cyclocybe aegerita TaxID=1973307 RepID=A0A8S0X8H4_CYCAE|nr:unnamed protein product [Cyclocybe aegerita]
MMAQIPPTQLFPSRATPISKLSEDVFHEIFSFIAAPLLQPKPGWESRPARPSNLSSTSDLRSLNVLRWTSQVCAVWRRIILSSTVLWGRVIDQDVLKCSRKERVEEITKRAGSSSLWVTVALTRGIERLLGPFLMDNWGRIELLEMSSQVDISSDRAYALDSKMRSILTKPTKRLRHFLLELPFPHATEYRLFSGDAPSLQRLVVLKFSFSWGLWKTDLPTNFRTSNAGQKTDTELWGHELYQGYVYFPRDAITMLRTNEPQDPEETQPYGNARQPTLEIIRPLEMELAVVEEQMEELKKQHTQLTRKLAPYRTAMRAFDAISSPFRRLPFDIIYEISQWCLPDQPSAVRRQAPLSLCQVSTGWRKAVLASPRMWSTLHVSRSDIDSFRRVRDMSKEWLRRAKGSLSLFLTFDIPLDFDTRTVRAEQLYSFLQVFADLAPQVRHLSLSADWIPDLLDHLGEMEWSFTMLHHLSLRSTQADFYNPRLDHGSAEGEFVAPMSVFMDAPSLCSLEISKEFITTPGALAIFPWSTLTSLKLSEAIPVRFWVEIMQSCSQLVSGDFHIHDNAPQDLPSALAHPPRLQPTLAELRMEIHRSFPTPCVFTLLSPFLFPGLRTLHIRYSELWPPLDETLPTAVAYVSSLRTLTLDGLYNSADIPTFLDILHDTFFGLSFTSGSPKILPKLEDLELKLDWSYQYSVDVNLKPSTRMLHSRSADIQEGCTLLRRVTFSNILTDRMIDKIGQALPDVSLNSPLTIMKSELHNPLKPPPAAPGFGSGKEIPEETAPLWSKIIFQWLAPFLEVGFSRPLEEEDFWNLPHSRLTASVTDDVEHNFYKRCAPEKRPRYMQDDQSTLSTVKKPECSLAAEKEGVYDDEKGGEGGGEMAPPADTHTGVSTPTVVPAEGDLRPLNVPSDAQARSTRMWPFARFFTRRRDREQKYDESLFKAIHRTFIVPIWVAGTLKLFGDTLRTTTPLLNRVLLTWLTESYTYARLTDTQRAQATTAGLTAPRGIGYGIGLAVTLFIMQEAASLMTNHFQQTSMTIGLSIRTGVIGSVFRKSLRLSGRARAAHSVGQITTMISTDATRLDRFSAFGHNLWVAPIQLAIGIGLLLGNLGHSALVGLGVLLLGFPLQFILVKIMFQQRRKGVQITDKRVRLTTEVLQGVRLIKFYAWEAFYAQHIGELRTREIRTIRKVAVARSTLISMVTFIPILASILSFITYALSGHELNIAIIFSSLQLFNVIRAPLVFFPFVLSSLSDALVALGRISKFLTSEDLPEPYPVKPGLPIAVQVDGDFVWETVINSLDEKDGKFDKGKGDALTSSGRAPQKEDAKRWWKRSSKKEQSGILPSSNAEVEKDGEKDKEKEAPFELNNLNFIVPKGAFIAIVGRVGSGKSSLLQALIGEMRRTRGEVVFGGTVAYAPQTPWIRNATLRENVLFGQPDDEEKFREVIRACSLVHDLEVLPQGEDTEIGEKGINLSGGQKARVSLARAAYSGSDIVLLDDPLSAVDAYVGKSILENCLLSGPLADRTRILVTHALHVLDKTDYIYVMENGRIIEQGTYNDLVNDSVVFSRLMEEYGSAESEVDPEGPDQPDIGSKSERGGKAKGAAFDDVTEEGTTKKPGAGLMQIEERNTGAVSWTTYAKYLRYAGGVIWAPFILTLLVLTQIAQVGNNLFLGFWTSESLHGFRQGDYMALYAALGVAQAILTFILTFSFALASLKGGLNLFKAALASVLRSPTAFFDTTPLGRILSRFSKDQDTLDNELSMTMTQALSTFSSVLGTVALVFYTFPYLGIIFAPMSVLYYLVATYYRRSSVETKRLDSLMRSILYGSLSETLSGLATIRAYREQNRSIRAAEHGLDLENRAYYMTISIQRWLGVRLDLFGNILILGIGLFAAGFRHSVNPAKIGVVLSYTLGITQMFSDMVSQFAQNEQNMNAVERILHYSELPQEGDVSSPTDPPPTWPTEGRIEFTDVELAYREGLPLVLKGVSFEIKSREKIGIVGRTGAGKSSLLQALFRMVELHSGKIEIDGLNIRGIGLDTLRGRLALVPQDSTLFLGTLRENLDPQGLRTDVELISVLQRAWLLPRDGPPDPVAEAKFSLDCTVGDEGANFSAGEKQLLALCRALVKNSKIIVLDEATSSVDVETDAKLQRTIQTEFASSTLLCIAHRLNTIAYYDRVLVMDDGKVVEYDTVLNLFDKEDSIFRSLCDEANLQRLDIVRIRAEHVENRPSDCHL